MQNSLSLSAQNGVTLTQSDVSKNVVTTKELAEMLGVDVSTVTKTVNRLNATSDVLPKFKQGQTPRYNEQQATIIKQEIQKHHNLATRQIDTVSTELEENQTIANAMMILQRRSEELKRRAEIAEKQENSSYKYDSEKKLVEIYKAEKNYTEALKMAEKMLKEYGLQAEKDGIPALKAELAALSAGADEVILKKEREFEKRL